MTDISGDPAQRALVVSPETERLSSEVATAICDAHADELLSFLLGVLKNIDAAMDVRQVVFQKLIESGHQANAETLKGWLFTVALREALNYRRQVERIGRHLKQYASEQNQTFATADLHLVRMEDVTRLKTLLSRLPVEQLQIVRARIYEDKTFALIADEFSLPLGTVQTRMRLAMEKLKAWMSDGSKQ